MGMPMRKRIMLYVGVVVMESVIVSALVRSYFAMDSFVVIRENKVVASLMTRGGLIVEHRTYRGFRSPVASMSYQRLDVPERALGLPHPIRGTYWSLLACGASTGAIHTSIAGHPDYCSFVAVEISLWVLLAMGAIPLIIGFYWPKRAGGGEEARMPDGSVLNGTEERMRVNPD